VAGRGKPEDKCVTPAKGPILDQGEQWVGEIPAGAGTSGGVQVRAQVGKPA